MVECLKDPCTRKYLLKHIGNELISMCSESTNSILRCQSITDLIEFTWDKLLSELAVNAPVFLTMLCACTHPRKPRQNRDAVLGICSAILLKHRFHKMCLMQEVLSLILYAGHSAKQIGM